MAHRLSFGFTVPSALDLQRQIKLATTLEALGIQRLWFADHLSFPEWAQSADAWTMMTAIAARTSRVVLGTAVSDPHRVPPAYFAQRAATLDRISGGRLVIGLGSGESMNLDPYGIPWDNRVARLKEVVHIVRAMLDSDAPVHHDGRFFKIPGGRLTVRPARNRHIPMYLAALGPKMQQFCGQYCDGWFPVVIPPDQYDHYFAPVAQAARQAGRDVEKLERVVMLPYALVDDERAMRPHVLKVARRFALMLVWPPVLERLGMSLDIPPHLQDSSYISLNPADEESVRKYRELSAWIPDEVLLKFVFFGNMTHLKRLVGAYRDAGATHVYIMNVSPDPLGSSIHMATELLPAFTGRPATFYSRALKFALPVVRKFGLMKVPTVDRQVTVDS